MTVPRTPRSRWRFRAGPGIDQDVACDVFSRMNYSFDAAVEVTPSGFAARICDMPMFYRLRGTGWRINADVPGLRATLRAAVLMSPESSKNMPDLLESVIRARGELVTR